MISQLPDHFFTRDGALYDTRRQEWSSAPPLRPVYDRHFSTIETTAQFKASLRAGGHTFPGGYTLAFTTTDGGAICFDCAEKEVRLILDSIRVKYNDGWQVNGLMNVYGCDEGIWCDHCYGVISEPFDDEELQQ